MPRSEVSVVVPVFNEERSIGLLLESLLRQTRLPDEVVMIDAGSTDATVEVIERYRKCGLPMTILRQGRLYPGEARNVGVEVAQSEIIAFTDAGIQLDPGWLEKLLEAMETEPDTSVVYGSYEAVTDSYFTECAALAYVPARGGEEQKGIRGPVIFSSLMRKSVWNAVGGFAPYRAAEDLISWKQLPRVISRFDMRPPRWCIGIWPPDGRARFVGFHCTRTTIWSRSAVATGTAE